MFQLNEKELEELRLQNVTANINNMSCTMPYAFTEQGIYMLATVLRGELAEQRSIFIMRAFCEMRHYIKQNQQFVTQAEIRLVTAKVSEISMQVAGITDWKNKTEQVYHCGASSKDAGKKLCAINRITNNAIIYPVIDSLLLGANKTI